MVLTYCAGCDEWRTIQHAVVVRGRRCTYLAGKCSVCGWYLCRRTRPSAPPGTPTRPKADQRPAARGVRAGGDRLALLLESVDDDAVDAELASLYEQVGISL